jgi:hypothetical protein
MRILLTNHELAQRTGTELLTAELARALRDRGHEVAVFTWRPGELAESLATSGIPMLEDPRHCPFVPEVIHGQHHLATMTALTAWPGVPGMYFCHGVRPFDEQPPRHPRLRRYLTMAAINGDWLAAAAGVDASRVVTVPNWFDPRRFATVRQAGANTGRAAIFSHRLAPGPVFDAVRAGCASAGLELSGIGRGFGTASAAPESLLPGFEVVFATGRSALEALACGCAVVPLDSHVGLGTWVTPEDFEQQRDRNWCVYQRPIEVTADAVANELARRKPEATADVTRRVRAELTLDVAVGKLESIYQAVIEEVTEQSHGSIATADESAALVEYLRFLAARVHENDAAFADARREARQAARIPEWRDQAAAARRELTSLRRRLERSWWGRRILGKMSE